MIFKQKTASALLLATGLLMAADAGAVELVGTPTVTNTFPGEPGAFEINVSDPAPPPFSADFSVLGDTTVTATWQAPVGQSFQISAPTGFAGVELEVVLNTEGSFTGSGSFESTGLSIIATDSIAAPCPIHL